MTIKKLSVLTLTLMLFLFVSATQVAFANTDGTEVKITEQPDKLILQLGQKWAGVEFELRTDAGVYPNSVVVGEDGILSMDLGGSKNYILSCLGSPVSIPDPTQPDSTDEAVNEGGTENDEPAEGKKSIPALHIILYLAGLLVVVAALIAVTKMKSRLQNEADDDYDDYDDE